MMPDRPFCRFSLSLGFALLLLGCSRAPPPGEQPPPPVVDPADVAANELRDRLTALDPLGCARDGEALVRQHPASGRLRAWWIGCVSASGRQLEAEALASAMLSERPGDPWAELARLLAAVGAERVADPAALGWSEALLDALPEHTDAVVARAWLLVDMQRGEQLLALAAAAPDTPASARVFALLDAARSDPSRLPEALAVAGSVAPDDPEFIAVAAVAAAMLSDRERPVEALAWAEAGLERAPSAPHLLFERWRLAVLQPGAGDLTEAVLSDIDDTIATYPDRPDVLLAAAEGARAVGRPGHAAPLEARILAEYPDSPEAESVLFRRLDPPHAGGREPLDFEAALLRDTMLAAYLARPRHHDPRKLAEVAYWRLEAVIADPAAAPAAILAAVEDMSARELLSPTPMIVGARALLERTPYHERAEALALAGIEATEAYAAAWQRAGWSGVDMLRRDHVTSASVALGQMYLQTGRLDDARAALRRAEQHSLGVFADLQLGLAELARQSGDLDGAEQHLVAGLDLHGDQGERCRGALADLYRQRTGSARGLSHYFADVEARAGERRKQQLLAAYDESAAPLPDFSLRSVDGGAVTLASLRGKLVVLHFWFTTCGGCLLELPEFSAFAAAHAEDPDLAVVSVHYGGSLGEVARWARERQLPFTVLMDDGYAERVGVHAYPTTWFIDPEGRRRFDGGFGMSRHLREEFDWRIEALRARAAAPTLASG